MTETLAVITPLHRDSSYIREAYQRLLRQSNQSWRWYILLNNEGSVSRWLPNDDPRIVVWRSSARGIGALKRELCLVCEEDWIVELDYDDLLEPNALEEIAIAFRAGADFVFSDFAEFEEGAPPLRAWLRCPRPPYGAQYGWTSYRYEDSDGNALNAMRAQPATAANLRCIQSSPNHVRAWRREAYQRAGGHDATMALMDDHDLMVRMFLTGARFVHVPQCLYLYRVHAYNTIRTNSSELAAARAASAKKWADPLARKEMQEEQDEEKRTLAEVRKALHERIDRWLDALSVGARPKFEDGTEAELYVRIGCDSEIWSAVFEVREKEVL